MPKYATKSRLRVQMERVSNQVTRALAPRLGPSIPQFYVCEYPRSGGTWLARMLADYFGVARPGPSVFPIGCRAVIHSHWKFTPKLRNVFVLTRDGRDVMTSYWFYHMRNIQTKKAFNHAGQLRTFNELFGEGFDMDAPGENMSAFLRHEFANPRGARLNWADYNRSWYDPERRPWIGYLTYEDLLTKPVEAMANAIHHVTGEPADERRLERTVEHFSMASDTGRKQGEEDKTSFIRKGIAGDWKNHFTPDAARTFDELAGDMLVKLGYEPDRDWVKRFEDEHNTHNAQPEPAPA